MREIKFKNHKWVDVSSANEQSLAKLHERFKSFHELDIEDCLEEKQRPKIDEYDKYLFIVLQFPYYDRKFKRFETEQLNIFIGQNYLVTVHDNKLNVLRDIFENCQKSVKARREYFRESTGYLLYKIISALYESYFPKTDRIQVSLKQVENEIFESKQPKDQLFEIMILKKNIITLRRIILPQRSVIAALEHKQKRFLPENLEIYFDDVVDEIEKIWNILDTQKEMIQSLEDTNESVLSHNINLTMRTLTVFSAIMLPLTFITGLFGMNVELPFMQALENGNHFWNITISMLIIIGLMFGIFKWKKWL